MQTSTTQTDPVPMNANSPTSQGTFLDFTKGRRKEPTWLLLFTAACTHRFREPSILHCGHNDVVGTSAAFMDTEQCNQFQQQKTNGKKRTKTNQNEQNKNANKKRLLFLQRPHAQMIGNAGTLSYRMVLYHSYHR